MTSTTQLQKNKHVLGTVDPVDLFHFQNVAILCSYFSVGLVSSFISTPLNIYLVEVLDAEPRVQNTIGILQTLPWSLKLIFGFLSDAVPVFGMHRKPYLIAGCLVYSLSFLVYALCDTNDTTLLALVIFVGTLGLICFDVMTDTMCVERSKFEQEELRGQMQATCYSYRFAGGVIGALLGTLISNKDTPGLDYFYMSFSQVAFVNGMLPLVLIVPFLYSLKETYTSRTHAANYGAIEMTSTFRGRASKSGKGRDSRYSRVVAVEDEEQLELELQVEEEQRRRDRGGSSKIWEQIDEVWNTVQLQAVWRPMAFVYLFNLFQIPNVAWQSYLQLTIKFEPWILGLTVTMGSFMTWAGVLAYKYWFFKASWRMIYLYSSFLTAFFSLLQLVLIFQINEKMHISNYFFSLGDDVISAYISGIQFLPVCIMYMSLCPEGAEGSSYAMLTTFGNIALTISSTLGNYMSRIWDVSNDTLRAGDVSGLWRLNLTTSLLSLLPLSLLFLLPQNAEAQDALSKSPVRSKVGGAIFVAVLVLSLAWTTSQAVLDILDS